MNSQDLRRFKLPDSPGVYFFKRGRQMLYIGRASSLRDRVRSYFSADLIETRGPRIADMVTKAGRVSFRKTDSVLDALLLEAELIQKLKPLYNSEGKDDKSFNCVVITDEDFPRVLIIRQKDIGSELNAKRSTLNAIYGPFPHGAELREALRIIRRIFPYRDDRCSPPSASVSGNAHSNVLENIRIGKPCFNRQIGLCPGVCTGEISKREYGKTIRWIRLFFEGRKRGLIRTLEREMKRAAKKEAFELAGELKRKIFALNHIQDIALIKRREKPAAHSEHFRIEAFDISHFGGKEIVGAMAVVENGEAEKSEYRLFKLRSLSGAHEARGVKELLTRRFAHPEWTVPELIIVDGNDVQKEAAERTLLSLKQSIPVIALIKDEKHQPRELVGDRALITTYRSAILLANSEAHRFALKFQRKRRRFAQSLSTTLPYATVKR